MNDTPKPQRIQLRRVKGWKMPPNTVSVARPHKWGNPYRIGVPMLLHKYLYLNGCGERFEVDKKSGGIAIPDAETACRAFRHWIKLHPQELAAVRRDLKGKNLACYCKLGEPCHADVLLELANQEP